LPSQLTVRAIDQLDAVPPLSDQLYRSARWLRIFTLRRTEVTRAMLDEALGEA
jgi:hypothetical protein